jgi:hypothetical protein
MGDYKEQHGKTRVGNFLQNAKEVGVKVAPGLLDLAANITGVEALSNLGDMIKGSNELSPEMKAQALAMVDLDKAEMEELTKRHAADMMSDSWLSKNVRPMILIFSWLLTAVVVLLDSSSEGFNLPEFYLNLLVPLTMTVTGFYFGARTIEKFRVKNQNK